jgi:uncharacterized Rmd1/YagE family protein
MAKLPVIAYGFATTFRVRELVPVFSGARVRLSKDQVVAEYAPDKLAVAFDFGALVFVNVSAEERARVIGAITRDFAREEPHAPLEEDFLVETRPDAPAEGEVHFDRVVIRELGAPAAELITLLLAQSVSIDYYDADLHEILGTLDKRTARVARTGRIGWSTRDLTRFVGETMITKNGVIAALAVLDKPAATWESEALDKLYRDLRAMLEIDERFKALEYKLRTIQDTLELLLEMQQTRRGLILEAAIVVLIVFEIVLSLIEKL